MRPVWHLLTDISKPRARERSPTTRTAPTSRRRICGPRRISLQIVDKRGQHSNEDIWQVDFHCHADYGRSELLIANCEPQSIAFGAPSCPNAILCGIEPLAEK